MFRAYDKGIEMGGVSDWLVRFELQSGKKGSKAVANAIMEGEDYGGIINRYIQIEDSHWTKIMGSQAVEMKRDTDIKQPDTIGWLRDVCAPSLAKIAHEHDHPAQVLEWFKEVVNLNMARLESEEKLKG